MKNENDALIKVTGVGICGTDLHILQVPPAHPATKDVILGHEFTGRIVEVGRGIPDFKPGESVLIDPHPGCGQCAACKLGEPDRCAALYTAADVDTAIKMGMGIRFPVWGPLEHIDAVGLDLALSVQKDVLPGLNNRAEPPGLLEELVASGSLGHKSGKGLYDWSAKDMDRLKARRDQFIIQSLKHFREEAMNGR